MPRRRSQIRPVGLVGAACAGLVCGLSVGCGGGRTDEPPVGEAVAQREDLPLAPNRLLVWVHADGSIAANGRAVSLDQLQALLLALNPEQSEVWYGRAGAQGDPPPVAMDVIAAIAGRGLPISFSTKPDFSDYVTSGGESKPREPGG